jgi:hypothetical protein
MTGGTRSDRRHGLAKPATDYLLDPERKLVTVKFGKKLTFSDIERYVRLLLMDPSFKASYSEIVDLTNVVEIDLQADEFLKLADKVDPFSPEAKRAFVAQSSVQRHAARMHKALRTQRNIEIFGSVDAALRWIAT